MNKDSSFVLFESLLERFINGEEELGEKVRKRSWKANHIQILKQKILGIK